MNKINIFLNYNIIKWFQLKQIHPLEFHLYASHLQCHYLQLICHQHIIKDMSANLSIVLLLLLKYYFLKYQLLWNHLFLFKIIKFSKNINLNKIHTIKLKNLYYKITVSTLRHLRYSFHKKNDFIFL